MARLASQANLQYIPTQDRIRSIIRSYFEFPQKGTTCFDPCCGPGDALFEICPDGNFLFGMELHTGRALQAKTKKFIKVLAGPFENSIISNRSFAFAHVNPPYDWVAGGGSRYEEEFLYRITNYICPRGILEYIVPTSLFECNRGQAVLKFLLENYDSLQILKYPEPEFQEFRQLVIMGTKKPRVPLTAPEQWWEERVAQIALGEIPLLKMQEAPVYKVPYINPGFVRTFRVNHYDIELAAHETETQKVLEGLSKPVLKDHLTAPYYLDKSLLALLAVGGYIDGKMPRHYLLGQYENHEKTESELDPDTGDETIRTRKVSTTVFKLITRQPGANGSRIVEIR